ncbi:MAG: HAMP domain-containing histidine kinase [Campylobacterales bacterium]|nr:HAMP domain-containing histidine kinase [Campylobacterales bacterium]
MDEIHKKNNYIIHQWRQSLNSISLLTEAIKLKTTMKDISEKTLIKITSDIYRNLDFMEETADSFSNLFKPSKKREYVVVQKSISKVSSILLPQLNTYKIPIQTLGDNCTAFIIDNEFQQVVLNILCNSRDILISNKISNPRIDIIVIEETNYIVVKIYDNGGGIPQTILTHLFKNYMTTKKNEGSEIGLTISKEIIENSLKGYLSAQNWEEGTCFTITLPKKPDLLSEEI